MRSSSLERNSSGNGVLGSGEEHAPIGVVTPSAAMSRLQASRTVWRSHDNEISYTSLNYEEDDDDQPVNYSLKYSDELGAAAIRSRSGEQSSQQTGIPPSGENVNMESKCTAKKVFFFFIFLVLLFLLILFCILVWWVRLENISLLSLEYNRLKGCEFIK